MKHFHRQMRHLAAALTCLLVAACAGTLGTDKPKSEDPRTAPQAVADAMLSAQVKMALLQRLGTDALSIDTKVEGNRVELHGEVDERTTQELASEVARAVKGVAKVDNHLRLEASDARGKERVAEAAADAGDEVKDAALEARIGFRLLSELGRHALSIEVESVDGVVTLRGTAPDRQRKQAAIDTTANTQGVSRVIDLLKVAES